MMSSAPAVRILSSAVAVPAERVEQARVKALCRDLAGGRPALFERMAPVFDNAGVAARRAAAPIGWYRAPGGWPERAARFEAAAPPLLIDAAQRALADADIAAAEIEHIVTIGTTGVATPSLEARIAGPLGLKATATRTPVFGLGCAGGVLGLARAAALARAAPGSRVLLLAVELCTLAFRPQDRDKSALVAAALFGDGAAALLLSTDGPAGAPALGASGEHLWPDTQDVMGWRVEEDGLGVVFSRAIPALIERDLPAALDRFLAEAGVKSSALDGWLLHPGGAKVLAAYERALGLPVDALADSRAVLAEYGNMSSVGVLAVFDRARRRGLRGRTLMAALGPGFTAGFQLLDM